MNSKKKEINFINLYFLFSNRLFENNNELLSLFQKFQNLKSKDDQRNSEDLSDHATNVMSKFFFSILKLMRTFN